METLKDLIKNATDLSPEEKSELSQLVEKLREDEVNQLVDIFQQNPEFIKFFLNNFKLKSIFKNDPAKIDEIIKKEEELLNNLKEED